MHVCSYCTRLVYLLTALFPVDSPAGNGTDENGVPRGGPDVASIAPRGRVVEEWIDNPVGC